MDSTPTSDVSNNQEPGSATSLSCHVSGNPHPYSDFFSYLFIMRNQSFHFKKNSFHIISCDFEEVEREVSYFILEEINYASEKCRSSQGHTEAN